MKGKGTKEKQKGHEYLAKPNVGATLWETKSRRRREKENRESERRKGGKKREGGGGGGGKEFTAICIETQKQKSTAICTE